MQMDWGAWKIDNRMQKFLLFGQLYKSTLGQI